MATRRKRRVNSRRTTAGRRLLAVAVLDNLSPDEKRPLATEETRREAGSSFRVNDRWLYIIYTSQAIQSSRHYDESGETKGETIVLLLVVRRDDALPREIALQFIGRRRGVLFTNASFYLVYERIRTSR